MLRVVPSKDLERYDAESLIRACDIAFTETGDFEFQEEITKLYKLFPSILLEQKEREAKDDKNGKDQHDARVSNAHLFFEQLDLTKPVLPQLQGLYIAYVEFKYENRRSDLPLDEYILDNVCLSGDLFRYHRKELVEAGLLDDMKKVVEQNEDDDYTFYKKELEIESEQWLVLSNIIEKAEWKHRDYQRNHLDAPCNVCGGKRDKVGSFLCKKCETETEKEYPTKTEEQRKADQEKARKEYEAKWDEIKKERDEILLTLSEVIQNES